MGFAYKFPINLKSLVLIFKGPNMLAQFCANSFVWIVECALVVIEPGFKVCWGQANVCLGSIITLNFCLVDHILGFALAIDRTIVSLSAITINIRGIFCIDSVEFPLVFWLNYLLHISHATIWYFQSVSVTNLSQGMSHRETRVYNIKELFANVCGNTFIIRGVKPRNVSGSVPFGLMILGWVLQVESISTGIQGSLIYGFYIIEDGLRRRDGW